MPLPQVVVWCGWHKSPWPAFCFGWNVPPPQAVHVTCSGRAAYLPWAHAVHDAMPVVGACLPLTHATQVLLSAAPVAAELLLNVRELNALGDSRFMVHRLPGEEIPASMELYALSKHASEGVVARWAELFGMPALSVRFSMVYGRLDRDTGARNRHNPPYWVAQQAAAGAEVVVSGDLDDIGGDYIAVEDVAETIAEKVEVVRFQTMDVVSGRKSKRKKKKRYSFKTR